jgi:hypothetical protein
LSEILSLLLAGAVVVILKTPFNKALLPLMPLSTYLSL